MHEVTRVSSWTVEKTQQRGAAAGALVGRAPFRAPHHLASTVSLVGRGSWSLRPGEVSLATPRVAEMSLDEIDRRFRGGVLVRGPSKAKPDWRIQPWDLKK